MPIWHQKQLFFVIILFLCPISLYAESFVVGKIVRIIDGDTLTLLNEQEQPYRIRLAGIDTPERGQPFGSNAKQYLAKLSAGKMAVADCPKKDRYGRYICVVKVNDTDIGLSLIRAGLAWHYKKYSHEQSPKDRADYGSAEINARDNKLGLWVEASPMSPWDWRHRK